LPSRPFRDAGGRGDAAGTSGEQLTVSLPEVSFGGKEVRMNTARRVALVADASSYVGPDLARELARRGHDLVLGDPPPELIAELDGLGAAVEAVSGVRDLSRPDSADQLVAAGLNRFGRIDAAAAASGRVVVGRFLRSSIDDLRTVTACCIEAPYFFLRAIVPVMVEQGDGQVLVITSASAARPTPGAPLYSAARAGATMLARNVALEVAGKGVEVNAVGTNFMDFPEFLRANGVVDAESRAKIEAQVPMRRLGTMQEFAHFCMPYLDGSSRFTTGQFVAYAGGWA
jgi:NAD(P)-dependent dehydrogenase (short-subunit alcohol dehydrogenase family)